MRYVGAVSDNSKNYYVKKLCHTYALVRILCLLINCKFQCIVQGEYILKQSKRSK